MARIKEVKIGNHLPHNRQTKTCAPKTPGSATFGLLESIEDHGFLFGWDADPSVNHLDCNRIFLVQAQLHQRRLILWTINGKRYRPFFSEFKSV